MDHLLADEPAAKRPRLAVTSKNALQEYTQRNRLPRPEYSRHMVPGHPPHRPMFTATVTVGELTFRAQRDTFTAKEAEHAAAEAALQSLPPSEAAASAPQKVRGMVKSWLQEHSQKTVGAIPSYATTGVFADPSVPKFVSTVTVDGAAYTGQQGSNRKEAERYAASVALHALGLLPAVVLNHKAHPETSGACPSSQPAQADEAAAPASREAAASPSGNGESEKAETRQPPTAKEEGAEADKECSNCELPSGSHHGGEAGTSRPLVPYLEAVGGQPKPQEKPLDETNYAGNSTHSQGSVFAAADAGAVNVASAGDSQPTTLLTLGISSPQLPLQQAATQ
eukprot:jgi/Mesen1/4031/ME000212S03058